MSCFSHWQHPCRSLQQFVSSFLVPDHFCDSISPTDSLQGIVSLATRLPGGFGRLWAFNKKSKFFFSTLWKNYPIKWCSVFSAPPCPELSMSWKSCWCFPTFPHYPLSIHQPHLKNSTRPWLGLQYRLWMSGNQWAVIGSFSWTGEVLGVES